jgi:hypothetical protein
MVLSMDNDFINVIQDPPLKNWCSAKRMINGQNGFGTYTYKGIYKCMGFAPYRNKMVTGCNRSGE